MYRPQRASPPPSQSSPILTMIILNLYGLPLLNRSNPIRKNDKEFVEPWTIEEEIALCKAWVAKSEDSVEGNGKKEAGFWTVRGHQSGSCDNTVYQEAELEYRTIYNAPFTLTECWKIVKDYPKWKKVEMPKFYKLKKSSSKKSRTSENTSQENSDSAHIGVNLNDEATDSEDVEAQEVPAPMGRDRAKRKGHHLVLVRKLQLQVQQLPTKFEEIFKICGNYDELFWLGEVDKKKLLVLSAKAALYKFSNADIFTSKPTAQSSQLNINGITRVPKQREDGWMEIQVWKFNSTNEFKDDSLSMNMKFTSHEGIMSSLIVYGLEFRPM
ncbi:glutathione S-transferase T3-like protein [Tanacetum coccineum]